LFTVKGFIAFIGSINYDVQNLARKLRNYIAELYSGIVVYTCGVDLLF
jgi:hypothetical protein